MDILGKQIEVNCKVPSSLVEAVIEYLQGQPFGKVAHIIPPLVRSLRDAENEALRDYHGEIRRDAVEKHLETEAKIAKARAKIPEPESE